MAKKIVYMIALTSSIGASILSIELAGVQLSIFRGFVILLTIYMLLEVLLNYKPIVVFRKKENSYSIIFMFIWVAYAIMTLAWVKDYSGWLRSVYFLVLGFLAVVIFSRYLKSNYDILKTFKFLSIMIYFHNIMGWYEITTGNYIFLNDSIQKYVNYKLPVSMFSNTNNFATFMLFSVFILYVCVYNSKKLSYKILNIGFILSSSYLLVMTGSRANILGFIMALSAFVFLALKNKRVRRGLLFVLGLAFFILVIKPEYIVSFYSLIDENLTFRFAAQIGSDATRINLIKNGMIFLLSTFGFGTGAGNIEIWMANYSKYFVGDILNIHNWWFEILVGYGIIIFIMYMWFYIRLFNSMYRKYKKSSNKIEITISLAIMSSMVGYIVGSVSSSSNISSEWLWVFWAIAIAFQGIPKFSENKIIRQQEGEEY
ncbi:teichuronic acid biosynthesis protein TuaE [Halolactibacillus halophilus]|uniref:Teichuronic acid biosynthesis protein TuaE n=1 Tax=Halolactibacillus halophilus TaxID=306540 RepID=A0A1I5QEU4_9BACI|nr:O-antigen ligase family protein [Halolactibacillus halophilus]GEM02103.1 hypothetical protein HHA03_16350 [Halolactibacillus halophilus]SFP44772.1 teichuronic acid biosynthesis protein TuaE [Halolactibacillus halophilus]